MCRSEKSAIGQHLQTCHTCDHNFNENQFKILSTANSDFDCKIREALLIKSEKPTLNQQLFRMAQHLFSVYLNNPVVMHC